MAHSEKLKNALEVLAAHGREVGRNNTVISNEGAVLIPIDGVLKTHDEIYALAAECTED